VELLVGAADFDVQVLGGMFTHGRMSVSLMFSILKFFFSAVLLERKNEGVLAMPRPPAATAPRFQVTRGEGTAQEQDRWEPTQTSGLAFIIHAASRSGTRSGFVEGHGTITPSSAPQRSTCVAYGDTCDVGVAQTDHIECLTAHRATRILHSILPFRASECLPRVLMA
jgi:hypothetical protein